MVPNRSNSLSFQMEFLKNFDRKSDSLRPFISPVDSFKVWVYKVFSKELLWRLGVKKLKNVFRNSKKSRMIPNRSDSISFQMKFLKNFDRKIDSVGPFIRAVEVFKNGACKKFSK